LHKLKENGDSCLPLNIIGELLCLLYLHCLYLHFPSLPFVLGFSILDYSTPRYLIFQYLHFHTPQRCELPQRGVGGVPAEIESGALTTIGRRSFPVAAAIAWNPLPVLIQSSASIATFRHRLKTFLFQQSFPDIII